MKIACVSLFGGLSPIMEKMEREIGRDNCMTFYYNQPYKRWWEGLINRAQLEYSRGVASNIEKAIYKFDPNFIIFDMTGEGTLADHLSNGWPIVGSCEFCDFLEMNRSYGFDVMKTLGFNLPGMHKVKNYADAMKFIKGRKDGKEKWVIKFNDNQGNFSSYCSEDTNDMEEEIEHFNNSNIVDFSRGAVFQEFIEGIEISCEGWFNGERFLKDGFNYTFEEKKFLTGSLGPSTGCEGNLVIRADPRDVIPRSILRISPLLKMYNYVGPFDINNIVCTKGHQYEGFDEIEEGKAYVLEPTPRFGYDAIHAFVEGLDMPISEFFVKLLNRELDETPLADQYMMGVRVSIPPYPFNDISQSEDKKMDKLAKKAMKYMQHSVEGTIVRVKELLDLDHIYFQDIRMDEKKGRLVVNGTDSVIGVVTAKRYVLENAIKDVYERVKRVDVPNAQYRLDIGKRAFKELPKLKDMDVLKYNTNSLRPVREGRSENGDREGSSLLSSQIRFDSLELSTLSSGQGTPRDQKP